MKKPNADREKTLTTASILRVCRESVRVLIVKTGLRAGGNEGGTGGGATQMALGGSG